MIELRHIQALSYALYASEDECYILHILDHIGDAALRDRLEPEIVVAQARLVAYQAEEQARIDGYRLAEDGRRERLDALEAEQARLEA
jgi:hypothetical protein